MRFCCSLFHVKFNQDFTIRSIQCDLQVKFKDVFVPGTTKEDLDNNQYTYMFPRKFDIP